MDLSLFSDFKVPYKNMHGKKVQKGLNELGNPMETGLMALSYSKSFFLILCSWVSDCFSYILPMIQHFYVEGYTMTHTTITSGPFLITHIQKIAKFKV